MMTMIMNLHLYDDVHLGGGEQGIKSRPHSSHLPGKNICNLTTEFSPQFPLSPRILIIQK